MKKNGIFKGKNSELRAILEKAKKRAENKKLGSSENILGLYENDV